LDRQRPEIVVTSHPNADLDALGSMVAARHLWPGAEAVLSQGAEPAANRLLEWLGAEAPPIREAGDIDPEAIHTLVVVDTADLARLGPFAAVARRSGVRLCIYDHHGADEGELPAGAEVVAGTAGSNTAVMVGDLMAREAAVTPAEATVMAAGIYEDTGLFTFAGVSAEDFEAARWLQQQGADLALVGRLLRQDLTPAQVHLLDRLLANADPVPGLRHPVVLAAVDDPGEVQDAANVVQRVMDSLETAAFLALIQQGDRVFVIGRARRGGPDIGRVAQELGGGGHAHAASASLPRVPLAEVRERVVEALHREDGRRQRVGELAVRHIHHLPAELTVAEAADRIRRFPLTRMPVLTAAGEPRGWVDQGLLGRAIAHGLGDQPLTDYAAPLPTVGPEAPIAEAEEWILDRDYPLVGMVEGERLTGLLTRSDLIRNWREVSGGLPESFQARADSGSRRNLGNRLRESLPGETEQALEALGQLAAETGVGAFLVGGLVRDLILRRPNTDVDVVVEGDAVALARAYAARHGWHVHSHERFGTAVLIGPRQERIDLASSRIEHYPYPAALPEVEAGSVKADLFRRDFTINALAVELDGPRFGRLLDLFGGLQDLRNRVIRVLHSLSFVEDPTRILRAVRFEAELDFSLDAQSQRLIRNAVELELPARLSGHRLFRELRYLLETPSAAAGADRLRELGMLPFVHPQLAGKGGEAAVARVETGEEVLTWYRLLYREEAPARWKVFLLLLLWACSPEALKKALLDFELRARDADHLVADQRHGEQLVRSLRAGDAAEDDAALFEALETLSLEGGLALMAVHDEDRVRQRISHYLQHLRGMAPALTGAEIMALGVEQGPAVGRWLRELTHARIRGDVASAEEEREWVQRGGATA